MKEESIGCQSQLPGAWFYEMGDDASASPTYDQEEMAAFRGIIGSRNCSESVEVPSSEHVAEIVGRQGCKIKALRAKTNTYIKTPIRGEDPVFVVTGKAEDVLEAKREIECAAEHFTQIRASRRHSHGAPAPGHVTLYVRVPLRVVGLVVGPKGATIKRIQQDTHTYIITPSREREPIFEVTGLPQNVEAARKEIEQHIYQRTGNMPMTDPDASITQYSNLQLRGYPQITKQSSYSAGGSPPAVSPSFFGSSSSSTTSNAFQPWSNNFYSGLGLSETSGEFILFESQTSLRNQLEYAVSQL
uniref:KH domain-containing protein n=1 Tax=Angiostrongylus cantonensis TaxID=6313 RepID=A0A0K0DAU0_ANGCA